MDICFIFTLTLTFVKGIWSFPLGCSFNETSYGEGEAIRTEDPCLSCACQKGSLVCSLRVCAEPPEQLSPGCFVIHKHNDCCPQLLCDCLVNGNVYAEGSALSSPHLCEYCYCIRGEVKCLKPRCFQPFRALGSCTAVFQKSSCCPTHYDCRNAEVDFVGAETSILGKSYPIIWNNSLKSFDNSDKRPEMKKVEEDQETEERKAWSETTTDESSPDEPLLTQEMEPTTEIVDQGTEFDNSTHFSFQAKETYKEETLESDKETIALFMEDTTWEPESTPSLNGYNSPTHFREEKPSTLESVTNKDFEGDKAAKEEEMILEEVHGNWSREAEDYDIYDYSEPKLPPSLPNLVIFPFVAADAVVKDDSVGVPEVSNKASVERTDAHPVFYGDHFSPPLKTEGGFVPKNSELPGELSNKNLYSKEDANHLPNKELSDGSKVAAEITLLSKVNRVNCLSENGKVGHGEILPETGNCMVCTCLHGEVVCREITCAVLQPGCRRISETNSCCGKIVCESNSSELIERSNVDPAGSLGATPDLFGWTIRTERPSGQFVEDEVERFRKSQNKKPVTVAYKNVIVNYYPDHLITLTRVADNSTTFPATAVPGIGFTTVHANDGATTLSSIDGISDGVNASQTPVNVTGLREISKENFPTKDSSLKFQLPSATTFEKSATTKSSFFYEIFKTFLTENIKSTTTSTSTKHKFSSKFKGHITTSSKQKTEPLACSNDTSSDRFSTSTYSPVNLTSSFSVVDGLTRKKNKTSNKTLLNLSTMGEPTAVQEKNSEISKKNPNQSEKPESISDGPTDNNAKQERPKGGPLKLAGCNIYGMMYRVGKIITELSGPCLECLCTDSGVQCTTLNC